jgi:hypothetical protein
MVRAFRQKNFKDSKIEPVTCKYNNNLGFVTDIYGEWERLMMMMMMFLHSGSAANFIEKKLIS